MPKPAESRVECTPPSRWPDLAASIERQHWAEIDGRLTERGFAHVPQLLNAENCESLRAMFDDDLLFAKTVTMDKERFGRGVYRYFAAPIPPLVDALRQLVYLHLAAIANRWQRLLNCEENYPASWPQFGERCAQAGQTTPSPLLLRYEAGGFNALHQDLRGEVFFPVQMVIVLSRRVVSATGDNAFTGGEFLFCDQPERKSSDRREVPAGLGDAVFFLHPLAAGARGRSLWPQARQTRSESYRIGHAVRHRYPVSRVSVIPEQLSRRSACETK